MKILIHNLNILLPFFYVSVFILYSLNFWKPKKSFSSAKRILLFFTILVHFLYLLARTIEFDHVPITNIFEIFTLLAFAITLSYYILELITEVRNTGMFILFIPMVFQIVSTLNIVDLLTVQEILRSPYLGIHVFTALTGYAGITFSAIYGGLYLMLYKQIKLHRFGLLYQRLPNLELLESLNYTSALIGFIMLTIAISIGLIWMPQAFTSASYFDPKLIVTIFIWILYAIGIITKIYAKWRGKRIIYLSLVGFVIAIFSMTILNLLFTGFHRFH
ncbi:MAG: cytochrome c biogenesis protein [Bacteroidetes bacterium]|nr:cytochrome c biogenesis protein [Bacteroidota bacterium]MBU2585639.1 cytochrome c biogenesis protein [Bacteroidota bacterium]